MKLRGLILVLALLCGRAAELNFSDLPKAAQRTINRALDGGTVQSIVYLARHAEPAYLVVIRQKDGPARLLQVNLQGQIIEPRPVRPVEVSLFR